MFARICVLALILVAGGPAAAWAQAAPRTGLGAPTPPPIEPTWQDLTQPAPAPAGANGTADATPRIDRSNDIDKDPAGWGWCRYVSDTSGKAYYSSVFSADVTTSGNIYGQSATDYMSKSYTDYIKKNYLEAGGASECQWWIYAQQYSQLDIEQSDEFSQQLQNRTVVKTQWHP